LPPKMFSGVPAFRMLFAMPKCATIDSPPVNSGAIAAESGVVDLDGTLITYTSAPARGFPARVVFANAAVCDL
jgi:hypothetical protein